MSKSFPNISLARMDPLSTEPPKRLGMSSETKLRILSSSPESPSTSRFENSEKRRRNRHMRQCTQRDSMRSRYQYGLPGSRRHRRYLNSTLAENEVARVVAASALSETDLDERHAFEWSNAFQEAGFGFFDGSDDYEILASESVKAKCQSRVCSADYSEVIPTDAFSILTEFDNASSWNEDSYDATASDSGSDAGLDWGDVDAVVKRLVQLSELESTVADMYKRVPRRSRDPLRRHRDSPLLHELEFCIVAFKYAYLAPFSLEATDVPTRVANVYRSWLSRMVHVSVVSNDAGLNQRFPNALFLRVADSYHRLLAHGVAQFYGLLTHSEAASSGDANDKVIVIRRPRRRRDRRAVSKRRRRCRRHRSDGTRDALKDGITDAIATTLSGHLVDIFAS